MAKLSRKRTRYLILLAAASLIVWRGWPVVWIFLGLNLLVSSDYSRLDEMVPPPEKPSLTLLGLSHPMDEPGKLANELLFQPRRMMHGHGFSPASRMEPHLESIAGILTESSTYEPWYGSKLCGGFHADYCFRWIQEEKKWDALLCMGCHEVILFHEGRSLRCDLSSESAERILSILDVVDPQRRLP
ncbi:MAG: hypothetical protein KDL87_17965 [Verrucomicrobiae bacterium]|nr:hypothetical protein [Verrucomicrobiae bacterium]